jgi:hypothetical protein
MYDIYVSYIAGGSGEDSGSCHHFFVAESGGTIVGCVGVKASHALRSFLLAFHCISHHTFIVPTIV